MLFSLLAMWLRTGVLTHSFQDISLTRPLCTSRNSGFFAHAKCACDKPPIKNVCGNMRKCSVTAGCPPLGLEYVCSQETILFVARLAPQSGFRSQHLWASICAEIWGFQFQLLGFQEKKRCGGSWLLVHTGVSSLLTDFNRAIPHQQRKPSMDLFRAAHKLDFALSFAAWHLWFRAGWF